MPGLNQVFIGSVFQYVINFLHNFGGILRDLNLLTPLGERGNIQDIENENGVIGCHRPPRFGDDIGVRQIFFLTGFQNVINDIVGVFLYAIVSARCIGRTRAIVIDT